MRLLRKNAGFPIKNVGNDREGGIGNDREGGIGNDRTRGIGNTGRAFPLSLGEGFVGFSLSLRERARVRDFPKLDTVVSEPTTHHFFQTLGIVIMSGFRLYRGGCNHDET